jgi:hypothetical protein
MLPQFHTDPRVRKARRYRATMAVWNARKDSAPLEISANGAQLLWYELARAGWLQLDPAVWRESRETVTAFREAVAMAMVGGWDAHKAAAWLMDSFGNAVYSGGNVQCAVDSLGLAINSINGELYMLQASRSSSVVGFRYLLGRDDGQRTFAHVFAQENRYGLGPGGYPSRAALPWPVTESETAYVVAIFPEEVTPEVRRHRRSAAYVLSLMDPLDQDLILGDTKAMYMREGLLKRWMLRAPLASVQRRLVRLGKIDGTNLPSDPPPDDA